ncbi:hypothetical protein [Helicobacter sp. MIT 14-3879]|uniref:hypothetical protein n=1 Tax=Helicobacter sp. MIT 14-3879 TaxID=2040649 RepID=UPI000E1E69BB|nr:hypothetical protein [Helicobacter sp. MIT 14-3879]RDU65456.1 hypothetical protein CQA44_00235 [Helicobacter sp. MIT 14-3879]
MSNIGKVVVIGVVGVLSYYTFIEKRNPLEQFWSNPVKKANKDYIKHQTRYEAQIADKNASVLQDDPSLRAITNK